MAWTARGRPWWQYPDTNPSAQATIAAQVAANVREVNARLAAQHDTAGRLRQRLPPNIAQAAPAFSGTPLSAAPLMGVMQPAASSPCTLSVPCSFPTQAEARWDAEAAQAQAGAASCGGGQAGWPPNQASSGMPYQAPAWMPNGAPSGPPSQAPRLVAGHWQAPVPPRPQQAPPPAASRMAAVGGRAMGGALHAEPWSATVVEGPLADAMAGPWTEAWPAGATVWPQSWPTVPTPGNDGRDATLTGCAAAGRCTAAVRPAGNGELEVRLRAQALAPSQGLGFSSQAETPGCAPLDAALWRGTGVLAPRPPAGAFALCPIPGLPACAHGMAQFSPHEATQL